MKLIELEDTQWFPKVLRDQQLGFIGWLVHFLDLYRPVAEALPEWIEAYDRNKVQDLCSGSGEPMISLSKSFAKGTQVILSDKFVPENPYQSNSIKYMAESSDVTNLRVNRDIFYTMFNAFHHFDESEQLNLISRLSDADAPFCFVEILQPNLVTLLKVILGNTIGQVLLTPFVKPFSLLRLLLTYVIPINLLTTTYDGVISVLKSKNKKQYQTLLQQLSTDTFTISVESWKAPYFNNLIVIQGFPTQSTEI